MSYEKIEDTDVLEENDVVEKEKTEGENDGLYEISVEKHNKDQFGAFAQRKELRVSGNQLDAHYSDQTPDEVNEAMDNLIEEGEEDGGETSDELISKNKNFIEGKTGKKIAGIKAKYFITNEQWKNMDENERKELLKKKQEEINNLYIKK
ncbi:MAG: hypothetical protein AB1333_00320 [Patescibacteria group bacterium]